MHERFRNMRLAHLNFLLPSVVCSPLFSNLFSVSPFSTFSSCIKPSFQSGLIHLYERLGWGSLCSLHLFFVCFLASVQMKVSNASGLFLGQFVFSLLALISLYLVTPFLLSLQLRHYLSFFLSHPRILFIIIPQSFSIIIFLLFLSSSILSLSPSLSLHSLFHHLRSFLSLSFSVSLLFFFAISLLPLFFTY